LRILFLILLLITVNAYAGDIPAPPPLPQETPVEQDYFQKIYTNWNTLEVTTTAPNGTTKGRRGKLLLYHATAMELWVNLDGETWWQQL